LAIEFARTPAELRGAAVRRGATPNPEAALRHSGWPTAEEMTGSAGASPRPASTAASEARMDSTGALLGDLDRSPLAGLAVLDFGMFAAGPFASAFLARLRAPLVKILAPRRDPTPTPPPTLFRGRRGTPAP